jgi:hypothetical protein
MAAKAPAQKRDDVTSQKRDDETPPKTQGPGSPARFKGVPRGPARINKREIAKVLSAADSAGNVERVELMPDRRIIIILGEQAPATQAGNELDQWMAKKNAR